MQITHVNDKNMPKHLNDAIILKIKILSLN